MQVNLVAISILNCLDEDEFVIGYAILYAGTLVKMIFMQYTLFDFAILSFGAYVFYRRYLMVVSIDKICNEIAGPLHDAICKIENLIEKKTT